MSDGYEPAAVPLYEGRAAVEKMYEQAQIENTPFFGVEHYDEGYAITFDLMPAGYGLTSAAQNEVEARLTTEIEAVVGDDSLPTVEVGKTLSESLGNISFFEREESARQVAAAISGIVLDQNNWVEPTPPSQRSRLDN